MALPPLFFVGPVKAGAFAARGIVWGLSLPMGAECDIIFKILFRPKGPEGRLKDGNENRKWGNAIWS